MLEQGAPTNWHKQGKDKNLGRQASKTQVALMRVITKGGKRKKTESVAKQNMTQEETFKIRGHN